MALVLCGSLVGCCMLLGTVHGEACKSSAADSNTTARKRNRMGCTAWEPPVHKSEGPTSSSNAPHAIVSTVPQLLIGEQQGHTHKHDTQHHHQRHPVANPRKSKPNTPIAPVERHARLSFVFAHGSAHIQSFIRGTTLGEGKVACCSPHGVHTVSFHVIPR